MSEILSIGELLDLGNSAATAGLIPYSALGYDGTGRISGISGSAIAGGVDSAVVSSIVSSYVQSGISGKVDQSAFDDCCSAMSSVVSSKLDASASSLLQPIGDYYSASNPSGFISEADLSQYQEKSGMTAYQPVGDYVFESAYSSFSGDVVNNISSLSSVVSSFTGDFIEKSASGMFALSSDVSGVIETVEMNSADWGQVGGDDYSGISPILVDNTNRTIGVSSIPLDVNDTMTSYVSGGITYFGVNESALNVSGKLDASASSLFLETSASSNFQPSGDYALSSDVSGVIDTVADNSAYWGGGVLTGDFVEKSATEVKIGSSNNASYTAFSQGSSNFASYCGLSQGVSNTTLSYALSQGSSNKAYSASLAQGINNSASAHALAQGESNSAVSNSLAQGVNNLASAAAYALGARNSASSFAMAVGAESKASTYSLALGNYNSASSYSVALGSNASAWSYAFAQGYRVSAASYAAVFGKNNLKGNGQTHSAVFVIGDGASTTSRHDLMLVTKDGEITMFSSTADTVGLKIVDTLRALSAWATANGWTGV